MPDWFTPGKIGMAVLTMLAVAVTWGIVSFTGNALWEKIVTEVQAQTTKELNTRIGTVESKVGALSASQLKLIKTVDELGKNQKHLAITVDGLTSAVKVQSTIQAEGYSKIIKLLENQR